MKNIQFKLKRTAFASFLGLGVLIGSGEVRACSEEDVFLNPLYRVQDYRPIENLTATLAKERLLKFMSEDKIAKLEANLKAFYATENGEIVVKALDDFSLALEKGMQERPVALIKLDKERGDDFLNDQVQYMAYVQFLGAKNGEGNFDKLIEMLPHIKELGASSLYLLPFLDSPKQDEGFDVRDYKNVLKEFGGKDAFDRFMAEAKKLGLTIMMDVVLNHVSEAHEWFQDFLKKGQKGKKDYFHVLDHPPAITKSFNDPKRGKVVVYQEKDQEGQEVLRERRVIFPDIVDNHYRKVTANGEDFWVYHTFYPFQMDLNYDNPEVMREIYDIIGFWANQGIDIFRMDAIPFITKEAENHPRTHKFIEILSTFLKVLSPSSTLLVEANQPPKEMVEYMGEEENFELKHLGKTLKRTTEAQAGYDFETMPAIWTSLIDGKKAHFEKAIANSPQIPKNASKAIFERVHDELSLEMVTPEQRGIVSQELIGKKKGLPFRLNDKGEAFGVGGRMADFLRNDDGTLNTERIRLANSILLSLSGMPVIYYGDEIGARNNEAYMNEKAKERKEMMEKSHIEIQEGKTTLDTRELNRGPLSKKDFDDARGGVDPIGQRIFQDMKQLIAARKKVESMKRGDLIIQENNQPEVLSYVKILDQEKTLIVHNLAGTEKEVEIAISGEDRERGYFQDWLTQENIEYTKTEKGQIRLKLRAYQSYWLNLK